MVKSRGLKYGRPNFNLLNNAGLLKSLAPGCLGDQICEVAPTFCAS
jgi:hypothetical protein